MRIGIDLGGTKIEGIALSDAGEDLARLRLPSPRGDYDATLAAVSDMVLQLEALTQQNARVGIGIPGAISPASGLVKNANSTWLIGKPFERDLEERLGRPVRMANDANCFALSEAIDGAGEGQGVVFGVILGTGVGGGVVVDGRVLTGAHAIAGEWGHNPLPAMTEAERPGPECYCGRRGCVETFLSGPALAREAGCETAEAAVAAADAGDNRALEALTRYEERLGRALAGVVNLLDPDVIVLGGGLSKIARLYEALPARMAGHVFSDVCRTPIRPPVHGDAGGVRGAAWLWPGEGERS